MKFILMMLICLISAINIYSSDWDFFPVNVDFYDVYIDEETIIVAGDKGTIFRSMNDGVNWEQIKILDNGINFKTIKENNQYIIFNTTGKIVQSEDNGKNWKLIKDFGTPVYDGIKTPDGYVIRYKDSISMYSNSFEKLKTYKYSHIPKSKITDNSLVFFNNQIITSLDSGIIKIHDNKFNLIREIDLKKLEICKNCSNYLKLQSNQDFIYFQYDVNLYKSSDLLNFDVVYTNPKNSFRSKFVDNQLYISFFYTKLIFQIYKVIEKDSSYNIIDFNNEAITSGFPFTDFEIYNNNIIITGKSKMIIKGNLENGNVEILSFFSSYSRFTLPDKIGNNKYFYYSGQNNIYNYYEQEYYKYICETDDNFLTFKPTFKDNDIGDIQKFPSFPYKYYDSKSEKLYFFLSYYQLMDTDTFSGALISDDMGKTFVRKSMENSFFPLTSTKITPNYQILNGNFIFASSNFHINTGQYQSLIRFFNQDLEHYHSYNDSNYQFIYLNHKSVDSFLLFIKMNQSNEMLIKYTEDEGVNWTNIKEYPLSDSILYCKDFIFKNQKYLFTFFVDRTSNVVRLEALNLGTRVIQKVYDYKLKDKNYRNSIKNAIDCFNDTLMIAVNDTLFITTELNTPENWNYHLFPDNGSISRTIKWLGNKLYARYQDDNNLDDIYLISLPKLTDRQRIIQTADIDFGEIIINRADTASKQSQIKNLSENEQLLITGITLPSEKVFSTNLPPADDINPIKINPKDSFSFHIFFNPKKAALYNDSIIFQSNANTGKSICYLNGKGVDTTTSDIDIKTDLSPYFYNYPPFPIPANKEIKVLIYWEPGENIDTRDIEIFNIYGVKIENNDEIGLDRINNYSGYLTWNCTKVIPGIYFIRIKIDKDYNSIKVIKK